MNLIELAGVSVHADGLDAAPKPILHDISLQLTEHRIALVGANGSGKSTLLKTLNGLVMPSSGVVKVNGVPTTKGKEVRRQIGYVFTDPLAQLVMSTPLDDVELSLRGRISKRAERKEAAMAVLEARGLEHLAHQSIYDLSGGERQLVSLATVLALDPKIVIADEPTTLLDLRNRRLLQQAFDALPQQLIVSTHDLELAATADRVIWIEAGRVAGDGDPSEVISAYSEAML